MPNRHPLPWLLALAALLYLMFPAAVLECDAVIYACAGLGDDMIQSTDAGHLAWGFLELAAARAGRLVSPPVNPVHILNWLAGICALGAGWLMHRLLCRSGLSETAALWPTAIFMFSYATWHYALQAESHLPSTLGLVAFAWFARRYYETPSTRLNLLVGVSLSLATLLHQTCILLLPAYLLPIALRAGSVRGFLRPAAQVLGVYVLLVIVPYLAVGWVVRDLRDYAGFHSWIMGLSIWGGWGQWSARSLPAAVFGAGRGLVGSHYLLGFGFVEELARLAIPGAPWGREIALAMRVPATQRILMLLLEIGLFTAAIGGLARGLAGVGRRLRSARDDTIFLLGWLAIYLPFIIWWAPTLGEFWIGVLLPLLLLIAPAVWGPGATGRRGRILAPVFAVGLLLVNLGGSIAPQAAGPLDPAVPALTAIDAVTRPGDILLADTAGEGHVAFYVYSLTIIDLLDPDPDGELGLDGITDPVARAEALLPAVLGAAGAAGYDVYILKSPISSDPTRRAAYTGMLSRIESGLRTEKAPVRGGLDLLRVTGLGANQN